MVEFAFVFPLLFLLVYGIVVYAYVYVLQQSLTYAAQQAADAVVAVDPSQPDADDLRVRRARETAAASLSWLPASQRRRVLGDEGEAVRVATCPAGFEDCPTDSDAMRVTLNFILSEGECQRNSLFPVVNLYLVGCIPPLPRQLSATAVVRI